MDTKKRCTTPSYTITPSDAESSSANGRHCGSCKEAIWGAYNKLYGNDHRLPRLNDEPGKASVHTIRKDFENHRLNGEW